MAYAREVERGQCGQLCLRDDAQSCAQRNPLPQATRIGGVNSDDNADATLPAELGADDPLYYEEALLLMRLTLDRMPERRRLIFEMSRMEGLSNAVIAEQLQLSVRTVEHQIYLALKELKSTMLLFVLLVGM